MNNEQLNKLVDETLNSLDGIQRVTTKPYFFTRLTAKMQRRQEGTWDGALRFLSRPAIAIACVLLVVGVNTAVFTLNSTADGVAATEEQFTVADDYNTAVASFNYIENLEP